MLRKDAWRHSFQGTREYGEPRRRERIRKIETRLELDPGSPLEWSTGRLLEKFRDDRNDAFMRHETS